jgi:hypothetical protein
MMERKEPNSELLILDFSTPERESSETNFPIRLPTYSSFVDGENAIEYPFLS